MDFVAWCSRVLAALIAVEDASATTRMVGVYEGPLGHELFGPGLVNSGAWHASAQRLALHDAVQALVTLGLALRPGPLPHPTQLVQVTRAGRDLVSDMVPLWQAICDTRLRPEEEQLLCVVNRLSAGEGEDYPAVVQVAAGVLLEALGSDYTGEQLAIAARELEHFAFVRRSAYMQPVPDLTATYQGLVWETRRGLTRESQHLDALVAEWETTSVDFKRELHTDTADQKAELVKDLLGLVNTQASGQRWLIIGFEDKTHAYHGPPDAKLSQNHLEQLMAQYTAAPVRVRYQVVAYRSGPVGKLEVLRDARLVPHRVKRALGDRKRIREGQVFVRHGSQTEEPTAAELQALEDEAQRANLLGQQS